MELNIFSDGSEYISAGRAAKKLGYTSDYIGQLCRSGKVSGKLVGRTWYIDLSTLVEHKRTRHLGKRPKNSSVQVGGNVSAVRLRTESNLAPQKFWKEASLVYASDSRSHLPLLVKRALAKKPMSTLAVVREGIAFAMCLIVATTVGLATLQKTNPLALKNFEGQTGSFTILVNDFLDNSVFENSGPQLASASFSALADLFTQGFRDLRNTALGATQIGTESSTNFSK